MQAAQIRITRIIRGVTRRCRLKNENFKRDKCNAFRTDPAAVVWSHEEDGVVQDTEEVVSLDAQHKAPPEKKKEEMGPKYRRSPQKAGNNSH